MCCCFSCSIKCLSVHLSLHPSKSVSFLSVCVCLSSSVSISISLVACLVYLSLSVQFSLPIYLSVCFSLSLVTLVTQLLNPSLWQYLTFLPTFPLPYLSSESASPPLFIHHPSISFSVFFASIYVFLHIYHFLLSVSSWSLSVSTSPHIFLFSFFQFPSFLSHYTTFYLSFSLCLYHI